MCADNDVQSAVGIKRDRGATVIVDASTKVDHLVELSRIAVTHAQTDSNGFSFGCGGVQPTDDQIVSSSDDFVADVVCGRAVGAFSG